MFVVTADIGADGLEVDRTLRLEPLEGESGTRGFPLEPVAVRGRVERLRSGFRFHGRLQTVVRLPCSRCLEPYGLPLALPFDLVYRAAPAEPGAADAADEAPDPEDPAVAYLDEGRIDLAHLIREQLYLALPLKPLCKADCRGLCPQCGIQRNVDTCDCEPAEPDPRWAALKALKDKL